MDITQKDYYHWNPLEKGQYFRKAVEKKTIYVHHTAGNPDPYGVIDWWNETTARVGSAFIIGGKPTRARHKHKDGELVQAFSTKFWAYHLGLNIDNLPPGALGSKILNSQAVAIEICNWGYLEQRNGKFYTYVNSVVPEADVVTLDEPYRDHIYWHRYTDAQLSTLKDVLLYCGEKFQIPLCYKGDQMFELDMRAFEGEPGVWTHTSVRQDKTDCFPQTELIKVLKEVGGTI
jgi:hypothetical protein